MRLASGLLGFLGLLVVDLSLLLLRVDRCEGRLLLEAFLDFLLSFGVSELLQRGSGVL